MSVESRERSTTRSRVQPHLLHLGRTLSSAGSSTSAEGSGASAEEVPKETAEEQPAAEAAAGEEAAGEAAAPDTAELEARVAELEERLKGEAQSESRLLMEAADARLQMVRSDLEEEGRAKASLQAAYSAARASPSTRSAAPGRSRWPRSRPRAT